METTRSHGVAGSELAAYYRGLLEEQAESGLSMADFAEDVGVSAATLYSWRRRLREAEEESEARELIEVEITEAGGEIRPGASIVLTVDGRLRIDLAPNFDDGALERLLGVLSRC